MPGRYLTAKELRKSFLGFFKERGHTVVKSSSLLPADPSVLFTTAGMQQFKPYYLGVKSPYGLNTASCQKCFRTSDIEEVGDNRHLTFLEMLGNFSFGGYFKEEAIKLAGELLISGFQIPISRLWVSYFKGDNEVPEDVESQAIWQKFGIPKERICGFSKEDNFWGPTGIEGPCGPTTEIYYDLAAKPCQKKEKCVPNCQCNRFIETWNLVFNEYFQDKQKKLTLLKQKGVDTGMGLERLAAVIDGKSSVFETDLFLPMITELEDLASKNSVTKEQNQNPEFFEKGKRIISDHLKGAVFLISEGVFPSNLERGYVVRRLLRRAIRYGRNLALPKGFLLPLAKKVVEIYQEVYPELSDRENEIMIVIKEEEERFSKTLTTGLKRFQEIAQRGEISGPEAFHLYDTFGFPLELTEELAGEQGVIVDKVGFREAFKKHQEISRAGAQKKFGGVGKNADDKMAKLHTATHLLHRALREVLGEQVRQLGSDITPLRLRFDFSQPKKMTAEEIKRVEELVNQKIKENLSVKREEMSYKEAVAAGALAFFEEKYPPRVTVYSLGDFSKEICAGPHANTTGELGHFKIEKEESSGAGIRRIRAVLPQPFNSDTIKMDD